MYCVNGSVGVSYLGRPWGLCARVVFQISWLDTVVNPTMCTIRKLNNVGPGAVTDKRVSFGGQLDAPKVVTDILGNDLDEIFCRRQDPVVKLYSSPIQIRKEI